MDISTVVVAVTGLGAALALYVGLRPSPAATPVPLPPEDATVNSSKSDGASELRTVIATAPTLTSIDS